MAGKWIVFEQRQEGPSLKSDISLNSAGEFWMNKLLFEKIGRPEAVTLQFDPDENRIGMQKSDPNLVYALRVRYHHQSRRWAVRSRAFLRKWDIQLTGTYCFPDLQIEDDMLVLPLNTRFNASLKRRR